MTLYEGGNVLAWSWRYFNEDVVEKNKISEEKKPKTKTKTNIIVSLLIAFFIVILAGQVLGFVNDLAMEANLQDKYKDIGIIVYSTLI